MPLEISEIEPTRILDRSASDLDTPADGNPGMLGEVGIDSRTKEKGHDPKVY
jgi:hypothetical protein